MLDIWMICSNLVQLRMQLDNSSCELQATKYRIPSKSNSSKQYLVYFCQFYSGIILSVCFLDTQYLYRLLVWCNAYTQVTLNVSPFCVMFSQNVRLVIFSQNPLIISLSPFSPLTAYLWTFQSLLLLCFVISH